MDRDDPARDPLLGTWLSALDAPLAEERLDGLAERIRAQVARAPERGIGTALLPWWKVVIPLAAAAGLGSFLMLTRATGSADGHAEPALVLLEAMGRTDGDRYLAELATTAYADGLTGTTRSAR
jgi:hypothetical protein